MAAGPHGGRFTPWLAGGRAARELPARTFFEAAGKADALGLAVVEGDSAQKVSIQIPKNLDYRLAPGEMDAVRDRMALLNVRMPVYFTPAISEDEPDRAKNVRVREESGRGNDRRRANAASLAGNREACG